MRARRSILFFALMSLVVGCGDDGGKGGDGGDGGDKPIDASPAVDGSPGTVDGSLDAPGTTPSIGPVCGAATCMNGSEGCCAGAMLSCRTEALCPTQFFACDGPEDCTGGFCCFTQQGAAGSECRASGQSCQSPMCHGDADCGGATPTCCPELTTPYKTCQTAC